MSERYTRLFTLPGSLYAQGSPLIILAGALLKDNQTGRVLAQLKFKNVGTKSVKAVKVSVTPLDAAGMENHLDGQALPALALCHLQLFIAMAACGAQVNRAVSSGLGAVAYQINGMGIHTAITSYNFSSSCVLSRSVVCSRSSIR